MQRETLYRGKLSHSKKWIEGNLVIASNGVHYIIPSTSIEPDGHHLMIEDKAFWVDKETVGQFTGTKDMDGEKLFEGDIIRNEDRDEVGVIVYDPNICFFCITDDYPDTIYNCDMINVPGDGWMSHEIKKIGNVHDNLELLNNQKQ